MKEALALYFFQLHDSLSAIAFTCVFAMIICKFGLIEIKITPVLIFTLILCVILCCLPSRSVINLLPI